MAAPHHGTGGEWAAGGLLPRPLRAGQELDLIAKAVATDHRVLLVDMPHHGRSAWRDHFDYVDAADQVAELSSADDPVALVGHSMGGKAAMVLALRHPELVERLCVVDVSPVAYRRAASSSATSTAMQALDLSRAGAPGDADPALAEAVPDPTVRSFLLQNLRRKVTGGRGSRTSTSSTATSTRSAAGPRRRWPARRRTTGPMLWVAARTPPTSATSTPQRWTATSRATAG